METETDTSFSREPPEGFVPFDFDAFLSDLASAGNTDAQLDYAYSCLDWAPVLFPRFDEIVAVAEHRLDGVDIGWCFLLRDLGHFSRCESPFLTRERVKASASHFRNETATQLLEEMIGVGLLVICDDVLKYADEKSIAEWYDYRSTKPPFD